MWLQDALCEIRVCRSSIIPRPKDQSGETCSVGIPTDRDTTGQKGVKSKSSALVSHCCLAATPRFIELQALRGDSQRRCYVMMAFNFRVQASCQDIRFCGGDELGINIS